MYLVKMEPKQRESHSGNKGNFANNIWAFTEMSAVKCFENHIPGLLKASGIALIANCVSECYRALQHQMEKPDSGTARRCSIHSANSSAFLYILMVGDRLSCKRRNSSQPKIAVFIVNSILSYMESELNTLSNGGNLLKAVMQYVD
jgi:hypothetical protein